MPTLTLRYSVDTLVEAEFQARKSLPEMVTELQSEAGASVATVRAMVLAGIVTQDNRLSDSVKGAGNVGMLFLLNGQRASALIEKYGIGASIAAIAEGLREFTERSKHRDAA